MAGKSYEGGIRPIRLLYAREDTPGEAPTDGDWYAYSDNARSFDPNLSPGVEGQRGLGVADIIDHFTGTGEWNITVEYDLQTKTAGGNTFYDGSSNPNDAFTDAAERTTDNRLLNTHTVVRRMEQSDLDASNTVNGSTSKDTRQYVVLLGGKVDTATLTGDPTSPQPITSTLEYMGEKAEVHQIDQPDSSTTLDVAGLGSGDIIIEAEGGTPSETLSSDGSTSSSFSDVDAVHLTQRQDADVTVSVTGGDDLMVIPGANSYDFDEGDAGVPALGSGSQTTSYGQAYEIVQGDTIERPSGTDLSDEVNTVEATVSNNVSSDGTTTGARPIVVANERLIEMDGTLFGETEYFDKMRDAMQSTANNVLWTLTGGSFQADSAVPNEVTGSEEASQGVKSVDVTFEGRGVTLS